MTDHRPEAPSDIPIPRTAALIEQLTREFGGEYTLLLTRAVEFGNRDDQARYMATLNAAIDVLRRTGFGMDKAKAVAIGHVGSFFAMLSVDHRSHLKRKGR
ncbi:hypothetical protein [Nocardia brasiliensis]|uniref:hypothetical protein n=1 Tax=Nocardia brasiliensis TaxID=37326 RepID=UPI00366EE043